MSKRKKDFSIPSHFIWSLALASFAILVIEGGSFLLFHIGELPMSLIILVHILVLVFFTVWIEWFSKKHDYDRRMVYFPLVMNYAIGPFGALVVIISGPIYLVHVKYAHTFADWYAIQFPKEFFEIKHQLYERIRAEREDFSSKSRLVPFTEVMRTGTEREKGEAITKILEHFKPEFSPALVMGLKDINPVIRVRAATAVARLEEEFLDLNFHYEEKLEEKPKDKLSMLELAESLEVYSACEFVDQETRDHSVERALALYKKCLQLDPQDDEVRLKYADLLRRSGQLQESLVAYERLIEEDGIYNLPILKGYMELLLKQKKYDKVREVVSKDYPFLEREGEETEEFREIVSIWKIAGLDGKGLLGEYA